MFAQIPPILAADDQSSVDTDAALARFEGLDVVIRALAKIAGSKDRCDLSHLAATADLAGAIAVLPTETVRRIVVECDSLAKALTAGLIALERARHAGRLNRSTAQMLYNEACMAIETMRRTATRAL